MWANHFLKGVLYNLTFLLVSGAAGEAGAVTSGVKKTENRFNQSTPPLVARASGDLIIRRFRAGRHIYQEVGITTAGRED